MTNGEIKLREDFKEAYKQHNISSICKIADDCASKGELEEATAYAYAAYEHVLRGFIYTELREQVIQLMMKVGKKREEKYGPDITCEGRKRYSWSCGSCKHVEQCASDQKIWDLGKLIGDYSRELGF